MENRCRLMLLQQQVLQVLPYCTGEKVLPNKSLYASFLCQLCILCPIFIAAKPKAVAQPLYLCPTRSSGCGADPVLCRFAAPPRDARGASPAVATHDTGKHGAGRGAEIQNAKTWTALCAKTHQDTKAQGSL